MYLALVHNLIDIRRGKTNNGCVMQDRSGLRTAIPTPCLSFSPFSKPFQNMVQCSSLIDPDEHHQVSLRKPTGCQGGPVPGYKAVFQVEDGVASV